MLFRFVCGGDWLRYLCFLCYLRLCGYLWLFVAYLCKKSGRGGIVIQLFGCLMSKFLAGPIARCACLITSLHLTYLDSEEALSPAGV